MTNEASHKEVPELRKKPQNKRLAYLEKELLREMPNRILLEEKTQAQIKYDPKNIDLWDLGGVNVTNWKISLREVFKKKTEKNRKIENKRDLVLQEVSR